MNVELLSHRRAGLARRLDHLADRSARGHDPPGSGSTRTRRGRRATRRSPGRARSRTSPGRRRSARDTSSDGHPAIGRRAERGGRSPARRTVTPRRASRARRTRRGRRRSARRARARSRDRPPRSTGSRAAAARARGRGEPQSRLWTRCSPFGAGSDPAPRGATESSPMTRTRVCVRPAGSKRLPTVRGLPVSCSTTGAPRDSSHSIASSRRSTITRCSTGSPAGHSSWKASSER